MCEVIKRKVDGNYMALHDREAPKLLYPKNVNILKFAPVYKNLGNKLLCKFYIKNMLSNKRHNLYDFNFEKLFGYKLPVKSLCLIGTPGPHQKSVIFEIADNNKLSSIIKFGTGKKVVGLLKNEGRMLDLFKEMDSLEQNVPTLLESKVFESGSYIKQSILYGRRPSENCFLLVQQFLSELWSKSGETIPLVESNVYKNIILIFDQLHYMLDERWSLIRRKMAYFLEELNKRKIWSVIVHRDFCPWNIKINRNTIGVYDWEYGTTNYPALYDVMHYILMPFSTKNKLKNLQKVYSILTNSTWYRFIMVSIKYVNLSVKELLILYFIDVSLLYLLSNKGEYESDIIVLQYTRLLEELLKEY